MVSLIYAESNPKLIELYRVGAVFTINLKNKTLAITSSTTYWNYTIIYVWLNGILNSKTLRPVTAKQKTIESKKVIFYVITSGFWGLYILKVLYNFKSATIIINVGYSMSLVSWVNANMYFNSSCEVNASDNGFDVTITADQIDGTENFSCTCVGIG